MVLLSKYYILLKINANTITLCLKSKFRTLYTYFFIVHFGLRFNADAAAAVNAKNITTKLCVQSGMYGWAVTMAPCKFTYI